MKAIREQNEERMIKELLSKPAKPKRKPTTETYYIVESEYGLDIKRYIRSIHPTLKEAETLKAHLDVKNPYDKHVVKKVVVTEVER